MLGVPRDIDDLAHTVEHSVEDLVMLEEKDEGRHDGEHPSHHSTDQPPHNSGLIGALAGLAYIVLERLVSALLFFVVKQPHNPIISTKPKGDITPSNRL